MTSCIKGSTEVHTRKWASFATESQNCDVDVMVYTSSMHNSWSASKPSCIWRQKKENNSVRRAKNDSVYICVFENVRKGYANIPGKQQENSKMSTVESAYYCRAALSCSQTDAAILKWWAASSDRLVPLCVTERVKVNYDIPEKEYLGNNTRYTLYTQKMASS